MLSNFMESPRKERNVITRSMKRVVLTIIESSKEAADAWRKTARLKTAQSRVEMTHAMEKLQRAVERLDRMRNAD